MEIERARSRSQEKAKKFNINSQSWFLTYPKLDKSKEEALALLKNKLAGKPYKGMVVCRELHQDGSPHIHAYVLLNERFNCRNERFWDLDGHHGDYQKARDIAAVSKYIKKDGDFIEEGQIDWKEKLDAKKAHRKYLGELMIKEGTTLKDLLHEDPSLALEAANLQKSLAACKQAMLEPCTTDDVKGIWLMGPPGVGKSHLVREIEPSLYLKAQNKWWDGYTGQKAVLIDDFDLQGACISHHLKIWTDRWGCTGEIKGAQIPLAHERFYVTSNYSPEQIFGQKKEEDRTDLVLVEAIKRRFKIINIENRAAQEQMLVLLKDQFK